MYRARSLQSTEGQGFPSRLKARILVRPLRILRQRGREPCSLFFRCGIRVSRLARGSYLTNQTTFSYGTKISSLRAFLPFFPFFFFFPSNSIPRLIFRALENFLLFFVPAVNSMLNIPFSRFFRKIATNFFQNM